MTEMFLSVSVPCWKEVRMIWGLCTVLPASAICSITGQAWIWKKR